MIAPEHPLCPDCLGLQLPDVGGRLVCPACLIGRPQGLRPTLAGTDALRAFREGRIQAQPPPKGRGHYPARLDFEVLGEPVGKGRGRPVTRPDGRAAMVLPSKTRDWQGYATQCAIVAMVMQSWPHPYVGPVQVRINALWTRPTELLKPKYPDGRMWRAKGRVDADNVAKCVCDALQDAVVIRNDSQVVDLAVHLLYAAKDAGPSVEITVLARSEAYQP